MCPPEISSSETDNDLPRDDLTIPILLDYITISRLQPEGEKRRWRLIYIDPITREIQSVIVVKFPTGAGGSVNRVVVRDTDYPTSVLPRFVERELLRKFVIIESAL